MHKERHMIPESRKRSATLLTLICFGVVAVGVTLGIIWVSMYMPR